MTPDLLVHRIPLLLTMDPARDGSGLGSLEDAAVAFQDGRVCWIGESAHAPSAMQVLDGAGCVGLPGLIDPHTHAVWAGSRAEEFERRLAGATYSEILEGGGGILSTVRQTRAASEEVLAEELRGRLRRLRQRGLTTVEVKSGYGLTPEHEARLLRVARSVQDGPRVVTTFLGAHTVPAEHRARRSDYVEQIIAQQLPLCAPLAEAVDVYCDRGAFDLDEATAILQAGKALGLKVRAHAEQVAFTGIAAVAARMGACCVDHLERLDDEGIAAMAEAGTVAVLLPGSQLYLRDSAPPVAALRAAGVPLALGTDLNPGSSPVWDPWITATLGCLLQGLTVEEALLGLTRQAGLALGHPERGLLRVGLAGDLVLARPPPGEPPRAAALVQSLGGPLVDLVVQQGRIVVTGI